MAFPGNGVASKLWKPCRFNLLEMCLSIAIWCPNHVFKHVWKIMDKCVYLPAVWPWDQFKVVCCAYCTYCTHELSNMHVHQPSQISGQGKTSTDYWEYIFEENHCSKQSLEIYCILSTVFPVFSSSLSLSPSPVGLSHIQLRILCLATSHWMHNQSLVVLIFLTFQQGLKGTELIWLTSILTVLPYSKAENAQAK